MIVENGGHVQVKLGGWDLAAEGKTVTAEINEETFAATQSAPGKPDFVHCLPHRLVTNLMPLKYYVECAHRNDQTTYSDQTEVSIKPRRPRI